MRFIFDKIKVPLSTALIVFIVCCMSGIFFDKGVAQGEVPKVECISSFYTFYGDSGDNRKHNVALAVSKIDGVVVHPEEEFSFNDVVGPRREERGFKTAYVIVDGQFTLGVGGGVCQVSSTLYNAVLLADLVVTTVHPHSLPVSYVAPSFDAMVSSGSDFCFVNTLSYPVTIKATADGKYIRFSLYGVKGRKISRRSETVEIVECETVHIEDDTLLIGQEVVESAGANGIKSRGYLQYEVGGKVVTKQIRTDFYAPQKRVVRHGTMTTDIDENNVEKDENLP